MPSSADRPGPPRAARASVAQARESTGRRSTLIIGGISVVAIIAAMVTGFILNIKATVVPEDGYGLARTAAIAVDETGGITLGAADAPLRLDLYQDATCDACGEFDRQYAQQMAKAADAGRLAVRYLLVDFYNPASPSRDYSTRAYAALLAAADADVQAPGSFSRLYAALFDPKTKPGEGDERDLTNAELAALARESGVPDAAVARIESGADVPAAADFAADHVTSLKTAWGEKVAGTDTPTVTRDGAIVDTNDPQWLTVMLGDPVE